MRILVIDHYAGAEADRGVYRALRMSGGADVTLLVPREWNDGFKIQNNEPERSPALTVVSSRVLFRGKPHRAMSHRIPSLLRTASYDIVLLNAEPESYLSVQAAMYCSFLSPRSKVVVMSWRNIDPSNEGYPYKGALLHAWGERYVLGRGTWVVAHTPTAESIFLKNGHRAVVVIPPAVDLNLFRPDVEPRTGARRDDGMFVVGYVGRFTREKGIDVLFSAIKKSEAPCRVILVGAGPDEARLRQISADLGLGGIVTWAGSCAHRQLPGWLGSMDALVLPSVTTPTWREQFGRVLIEAMACGVPVVGSDSGEIPHVIGDAGVVFREGDNVHLAQVLRTLAGDAALRGVFKQKGRLRVEQTFSVDVIAGMYLRLFDRILANN
jgi:glycosyltransferase involved in cell wall biosynthesis